jgi:CDP-diacylglycerol pyrophosphatase
MTETAMRKWRALLGAAAVACAALAALPATGRAADADALKRIVEGMCVPAMTTIGHPLPCRKVDLSRRYAVLKDINGRTQYLLIPTDPVAGIEAPSLLSDGARNYWQDAWEARMFVEEAAGRPIARDLIGLAINSAKGRSQNQLHIHVDCVRRDVVATLRRYQSAIGPDWRPLPFRLRGHRYLATRVEGANLGGVDPFRLLADKVPRARAAMGDQTLVVIGATFKNGKPGFYVLDDYVGASLGDFASGEELLDHACAVLGANP